MMNIVGQGKPKQIPLIAIGAGKGGVGKSSFTVAIAHLLKKLSLKVGIIDADLYGPSLSLMLPPQIPLRVEASSTIIPAISRGIKVVSLSHFTQGREVTIVRAPIANATIKSFIENSEWGDIDLVLIDLPPGTGDILLTLMQTIPLKGGIIITTPSQASIIDVKKSIEMFIRMEVPLLGLVENMSYIEDPLTLEKSYPFGSGRGEALAKERQIPFLGKIPLEEQFCAALDSGLSPFESAKATSLTKAYEEIAIEIRSQICDDRGENNKIEKIDKQYFELVKGSERLRYRFKDVQKSCPCARCVDEITGKRIVDEEMIDERVTAHKIELIGNYGCKFSFSSGCSQGIYSWNYLEKACLPLSRSS